jgi:hypothetical protein
MPAHGQRRLIAPDEITLVVLLAQYIGRSVHHLVFLDSKQAFSSQGMSSLEELEF